MGDFGDGPDAMGLSVDSATLRSRSIELPDVPPEALLRTGPAPHTLWDPPDGPAVATAGDVAVITASGDSRFMALKREADTLFDARDGPASPPAEARPRFVGGFAFHGSPEPGPPWRGFPAAQFVLPRFQLVRSDRATTLTVTTTDPSVEIEALHDRLRSLRDRLVSMTYWVEDPPGISSIDRVPDRTTWRRQVDAVLDRIADGTLAKVVLAQALRAELGQPIDPVSTIARLGARTADSYRFLITPQEGATAIGATPERLVAVSGRTLETEALAGSIGRGDTAIEDEALATTLTESAKDDHEHALVVDAIREQLAPHVSRLWTGERRVRRLDSVQHLETPITGLLAGDPHVLTLAEALHPTPAVGGLPPDAAQRTIRATEAFERGWYAAPIGWFDAHGNGEFVVAIRSAVLESQAASLFAGAGIVEHSDPETEWDEVQLKFRPILDALEA